MENLPSQQPTKPSTDLFLTKILREYPKIRSLKNFVPIEQALARCFILVGIPAANYPKGVEKDVLIDHIVKSYPGYVSPEIITAFEKAVNREYSDVDYDVLLKHYGTFSAEYLGRIMTVYTEQHRNEVLRLNANKTPLYKQPEFDRIASFEIGFYQKFDKFVKNNEFEFPYISAAYYYDQLREMELIESTKEERAAFGAKARERTPMKKDKIGKPLESKKDHEYRIIQVAKSLMLHEWFKSEAMNETDIRLLISPLLNKSK
jgi:hypothetical protein